MRQASFAPVSIALVASGASIGDLSNANWHNRSEYLWMDAQKKSSSVPAPQYIDFVMSWIQAQVHDENTFPTKDGK